MSLQVTGADLSPLENLPTPLPIHVVSNTPGRLRFRVTHEHRQPETLAAIAHALKSFSSQIQTVRTTTLTGSVTVYYTGDVDSFNHALTSLQQFGVVVLAPLTGQSKASVQVSSTMTRANQWVQAKTEGAVDLRFLVPLMFGILALRQVLVQSPKAEYGSLVCYGPGTPLIALSSSILKTAQRRIFPTMVAFQPGRNRTLTAAKLSAQAQNSKDLSATKLGVVKIVISCTILSFTG